jgi:hypothetical protein
MYQNWISDVMRTAVRILENRLNNQPGFGVIFDTHITLLLYVHLNMTLTSRYKAMLCEHVELHQTPMVYPGISITKLYTFS